MTVDHPYKKGSVKTPVFEKFGHVVFVSVGDGGHSIAAIQYFKDRADKIYYDHDGMMMVGGH